MAPKSVTGDDGCCIQMCWTNRGHRRFSGPSFRNDGQKQTEEIQTLNKCLTEFEILPPSPLPPPTQAVVGSLSSSSGVLRQWRGDNGEYQRNNGAVMIVASVAGV